MVRMRELRSNGAFGCYPVKVVTEDCLQAEEQTSGEHKPRSTKDSKNPKVRSGGGRESCEATEHSGATR